MACWKQNNTVENEKFHEYWGLWLADVDEGETKIYFGVL